MALPERVRGRGLAVRVTAFPGAMTLGSLVARGQPRCALVAGVDGHDDFTFSFG